MGSRAHFVIVDGPIVELYYDHWGAQTLARDILLDGQASTLTRIRSMTRVDPNEPDNWLDDTWGEGGLVLDLKKCELAWFDSPFESVQPRLAAYLLERTWPGWRTVWLPLGMRGLLHYLGLHPKSIMGEREGRTHEADPALLLDPFKCGDQGAGLDPWVANCAVVTMRFEDGALWTATVGTFIDALCELPWNQVERYLRACWVKAGGEVGPSSSWRLDCPEAFFGAHGYVEQGAWVDISSREFHWWSLHSLSGFLPSLRRNWPGFRPLCHGDRHEWHELHAGLGPLVAPLSQVLDDELAQFTDQPAPKPRGNPAVSAAMYLADHGGEVEISPHVFQAVPATAHTNRQAVLGELKRLIASRPAVLTPPAYLDVNGQLVS